MQVLSVTNLQNLTESREGNDAKDANGNEYELKSVNIRLTKSFSTNHHLNPKIIAKYRKVDWIFAVYDDIELLEIYLMTPEMLEPYYTKWEQQYDSNHKDINNPKIPLEIVRKTGISIFRHNEDYTLYPAAINMQSKKPVKEIPEAEYDLFSEQPFTE